MKVLLLFQINFNKVKKVKNICLSTIVFELFSLYSKTRTRNHINLWGVGKNQLIIYLYYNLRLSNILVNSGGFNASI